jgi:ABC-2 type transport system ATP-binding protein
MDAIVADQLVKHFSPEIKAVDGIDLAIPEGQVFGFLGQNGSGKTTTVRMLTTLLKPTSGRASVAGFDVVKRPVQVRKSIGVALQEVGLDDLQTGRELLTLQARLYGLRGDTTRKQVNYLLQVVDLTDAADRRIGGYSGGMQRRLDLAAALVHNPRILFLDEPTTGLDPISRESVWRYIRELNQSQGVTVFLTTQYLEEADRLCAEIAIMNAGKIIAQGSPEALKASVASDVVTVDLERLEDIEAAEQELRKLEGVQEIRILGDQLVLYISEGARAVPRIILMLQEASLPVDEVILARPTLDDVFLQKTGHHIEPVEPPSQPQRPGRGGH